MLKQGFSNVIPRPAASGSQPPGNLLGMQIPGLHPRPPESETLGVGPGNLILTSSPENFLHVQI